MREMAVSDEIQEKEENRGRGNAASTPNDLGKGQKEGCTRAKTGRVASV
jgi:hypothetical protein